VARSLAADFVNEVRPIASYLRRVRRLTALTDFTCTPANLRRIVRVLRPRNRGTTGGSKLRRVSTRTIAVCCGLALTGAVLVRLLGGVAFGTDAPSDALCTSAWEQDQQRRTLTAEHLSRLRAEAREADPAYVDSQWRFGDAIDIQTLLTRIPAGQSDLITELSATFFPFVDGTNFSSTIEREAGESTVALVERWRVEMLHTLATWEAQQATSQVAADQARSAKDHAIYTALKGRLSAREIPVTGMSLEGPADDVYNTGTTVVDVGVITVRDLVNLVEQSLPPLGSQPTATRMKLELPSLYALTTDPDEQTPSPPDLVTATAISTACAEGSAS
jgi:hypothetical protein